MNVAKAREGLMRKSAVQEAITWDRLLSTGSTLLNLACTGRPEGGFVKGHYYFFVGDSTSGKTFLTLTCLAEASINPAFDGYRLIYDNVESGALMDLARFFGQRVADRVEAPRVVGGDPACGQTIEDLYYNIDDAIDDGRPFIYVVDSQDSLTSRAEVDKFNKTKRAVRKKRSDPADDERVAGSYGDGKPKIHSSNIRKLMGPLARMGSILIVLNQTRDSFSMFEKSTYSGGRALKFYATLQLWSSVAGSLDKVVNGKKRQLGTRCKIRVKKNRVTGRDRTVLLPIYHSTGIDETGSLVDYLCEEGAWSDSKGVIEVTGLGPAFSARRESLIRKIEDEDLVQDVRDLAVATWDEIERQCEVQRKPRY